MRQAGPILTFLISLFIVICCSIPIALNWYLSDEKYKETKSEYRRNKDEFDLDK